MSQDSSDDNGDWLTSEDNGDEISSTIVVGKYHRHVRSTPAKRSYGKEVVSLDNEDMEPAKSVGVEMANKGTHLEFDSQKIMSLRGHTWEWRMTKADMECLDPGRFLWSPAINFYIEYLQNFMPCDDILFFNSHFYASLETWHSIKERTEKEKAFAKLRRWDNYGDLFKRRYVLLPINVPSRQHWCLVIIFMPVGNAESGLRVFHLDSLRPDSTSSQIFRVIKSFLVKEWTHLQKDSSYNIPFANTIWSRLPNSIHKKNTAVPIQKNGFDCGVFMLYYIEKFIEEAPDSSTGDRPCKFGREWFKNEELEGLRRRIRYLVSVAQVNIVYKRKKKGIGDEIS